MRSDRDQLGMPNQFLGFALFTPRVTQIYRTRTVKMGLVIHIKRVSFLFFFFLFKAVLPLENFLPFFFNMPYLILKQCVEFRWRFPVQMIYYRRLYILYCNSFHYYLDLSTLLEKAANLK